MVETTFGQQWYGGIDFSWDQYVKARPEYSSNLLSKLFTYHKEHSGQFDAAADFGCGSGTLLPDLLQRFQTVYASDINEPQLETIKENIVPKATEAGKSLRVHMAKAEDPHAWIPDASVDLCIAGMACQWFANAGSDWVKNCARILKPHGTIAVLSYSPLPVLRNRPEANKLIDSWFVDMACLALKYVPDSAGLKPMNVMLASGTHNLQFDQTYYDGVQRVDEAFEDGNVSARICQKSSLDFISPTLNPGRTTPSVIYRDVDSSYLARYLCSVSPTLAQATATDEWKQLAQRLDADGPFDAHWEMHLSMASQRSN